MRVIAVVLGAIVGALALPPFDWPAFAWLALAPLLLAVRGQPTGDAFRYGALAGYVYGWATTWSIAEVGTAYFGLPLPIGIAAFALYYLIVIGVPFGLFAAGSALLQRTIAWHRACLLIPALWVASELLRARVFGQPWALLGYSQHDRTGLIQIATVTGVYGVSFLVALGGTAVAEAARRVWMRRGPREVAEALALPSAIVVACTIAGSLCLDTAPQNEVTPREVAVVQTDVSPARHWSPTYTRAQLTANVRVTDALPVTSHPALIVWPENAVPTYLESEPMLAVELAGIAARHRADLLFGGPRYEDGSSYNSARLITAAGRNGGHYDKRRLVLFAEEKPLVAVTSPTTSESIEEFRAGSESGVLASFVPLGISICHEVTHPDLSAQAVRDGAQLLVNIANDGWLDAGYEFAGRQHLDMAMFRAVETRRYLVRASTTGPSAVIDPYGRVVASLAPGTSGVLTATVAGRRGLTPYARLGDAFALASGCLAAAALLGTMRPRIVHMAVARLSVTH